MIKIIVDDKIPFIKGVLESYADVVYLPWKQIDRASVLNADALIIRTRTKCTETLLTGTKVRFIGTATIGFDHIDTRYCNRHKITWTNAPGCNSSSVQQYITASLLKLSRDHQFILKDKTIGIIGVGKVGSKVEEIARILGMKVLLNDPPRARKEKDKEFVLLGNILYESDIVTVHVPLKVVGEDKTYHMFNSRSFKKMKKGSWFINSSRGEVVNTACLKLSLNSGKLGGSIIDVWENEPDIDLELMGKSFISTPHIAGYSADGKANGIAMVVNSLSDYFNLPLKNWYPENVPVPLITGINIDCRGKSDEEIIRAAVQSTYNIEEDDFRLRFSPADFEQQRGDYPLRREFNSFSVKLKGCSATSHKALEAMGFRVLV